MKTVFYALFFRWLLEEYNRCILSKPLKFLFNSIQGISENDIPTDFHWDSQLKSFGVFQISWPFSLIISYKMILYLPTAPQKPNKK